MDKATQCIFQSQLLYLQVIWEYIRIHQQVNVPCDIELSYEEVQTKVRKESNVTLSLN